MARDPQNPHDAHDPYEADNRPQPDWYGTGAKRKNDQPERGQSPLQSVVLALIALAVIVAGCAVISLIVFDPLRQRVAIAPTLTSRPTLTPTVTLTPSPIPPTLTPTVTRTPEPIRSMVIRIFNKSGDPLYFNPNDVWAPGYKWRGFSLTKTENFVAFTADKGDKNCDVRDGYRQVYPNNGAFGTDPRLVNPKALVTIGDYRVILAADCVRQVPAVFLFDRLGTPLDIFPIIGGDSLVDLNGRLLVSLSGFQGAEAQYHWIELRIDAPTRTLQQVDQYVLDEPLAVYRSAAYHKSVGLAFIRATEGMEVLQVANLYDVNPPRPLSTLVSAVTVPTLSPEMTEFPTRIVVPTFTPAPTAIPKSEMKVITMIRLNFALTDLQFSETGTLYALDRAGKRVLRFSDGLTSFTEIPIRGMTPYSFGLDPDEQLHIAGYLDNNP